MNRSTSACVNEGYRNAGWWILLAALTLTTVIYSVGLSGGYLFDDYPNIVDNAGVQPHQGNVPELVTAALSSPASEFKRPLASLTFAANFLATGLDPYWMKLTNLAIHCLNGLLTFLLARSLLYAVSERTVSSSEGLHSMINEERSQKAYASKTGRTFLKFKTKNGIVAALIAGGWLLLPINLTGVLYVVQRMESMANLFVVLGLIGYVTGRRHMLVASVNGPVRARSNGQTALFDRHFLLCLVSITIPTALGIMAKETAVMLPFYALLVEWAIFRFAARQNPNYPNLARAFDGRLAGMFCLIVLLPSVIGLAWVIPNVLKPATWATRDFTLGSRLLSEARIVVDYIVWTLMPTPQSLAFYHDDFQISTGLLCPISTLFSIGALVALIALMLRIRKQLPLVSLGVALFFGCHLLTGTILPLELVYEHRNYFASFGLLLAIVPLLAAPERRSEASLNKKQAADVSQHLIILQSCATDPFVQIAEATSSTAALPMAIPRYSLLIGLMICWAGLTALTAYAWGEPLRLAEDLAARAPMSPRAQYELGRTYIIYSHYDPKSPFVSLAAATLEKAAALPRSSILPEQALIFMNARMKLPITDAWWDSMIVKLKTRKPGVQDESSLSALTQCDRDGKCSLPKQRMTQAYSAALSHPNPSARLLAMYADYAWNILGDRTIGESMAAAAIEANPKEPAYQITLIRMLAAENRAADAKQAVKRLQLLNFGGRLDASLAQLKTLQALQ